MIEVAHLHKAYGHTVAIEDVSFTVHAGEIFGILGRNGAGKTTTVECITGLRAPDRGEISVLGLDPRRDGSELHERVGVQLQQSALPELITVREAVELYASFYRDPPTAASCSPRSDSQRPNTSATRACRADRSSASRSCWR